VESVFVILLSAISLSFLLKQQQKTTKGKTSPYSFWDHWAKQENFYFYPPSEDLPMNIVAEISPYTVDIYARVIGENISATEIKIPIRYIISSGFWLQQTPSLEAIRIVKNPTIMEYPGRSQAEVHVESKDAITTKWLLSKNEYKTTFDRFLKHHPKSHIEQRAVVMYVENRDIAAIAKVMAEGIEIASQLDNIASWAWRKFAESNRCQIQRQYGYPILWGKLHELRYLVTIPNTQIANLECIVHFPDSFPIVNLWGLETKKGHEEPKFCTGHVVFESTEAEHKEIFVKLLTNSLFTLDLTTIFKEYPKTSLYNRILRVRFQGKINDVFYTTIHKVIGVSDTLAKTFIPEYEHSEIITLPEQKPVPLGESVANPTPANNSPIQNAVTTR
jgi:hypothetical protein